jgi:hypothetical protein
LGPVDYQHSAANIIPRTAGNDVSGGLKREQTQGLCSHVQ